MNYVLGIFPDESTRYEIRKVLADVGKIFETQDIPVTYANRDTYHITLLFFGQKMGFAKRKYVSFKLKSYVKNPFEICMSHVRLGISRDRKELLFLPITDGADDLREMVYEVSGIINFKRGRKFIPHVTLGRVRKDLTDQEFTNLTKSISEYNQSEKVRDITFSFIGFELVKFQPEGYETLNRFQMPGSSESTSS